MHIVAFIIAVLGIVAFGVEWYRTRSLIAAGLTLVSLAWVLVLTLEGGDRITFG